MPWSSHWHVGPVFNTNIEICMLDSVSPYKAQNKAQKYHSSSVCSNSWHVHLCMCRDSYKLPNRKGFFVPLTGAPGQVVRLLQWLSLLDAKASQMFRQNYFYWNC